MRVLSIRQLAYLCQLLWLELSLNVGLAPPWGWAPDAWIRASGGASGGIRFVRRGAAENALIALMIAGERAHPPDRRILADGVSRPGGQHFHGFASVLEVVFEWNDVFDIDVHPAVWADEGLRFGPEVFGRLPRMQQG